MILYEGNTGMQGNEDLETIEKWCIKEKFLFSSVYLISANLMIKSVADKKNIKINVIPIQMFDQWNFSLFNKISNPIDFNPVNEKNLYLCYNRFTRWHRVFIINELIENNIFNRGLLSLNIQKKNFIKLSYMTDNTFNFIEKELPILIDNMNLTFNKAENIVVEDYRKTFISIINETLVENDTLFITEKTWKPIIMGHPFVIYGNTGTLKYLKDLGYKTFDKWVDESYDMEEDSVVRGKLIVKEIEKISKYSIEELKSIREEMYDVCYFNRCHFEELINKNYTHKTNITLINTINDIWKKLLDENGLEFKDIKLKRSLL